MNLYQLGVLPDGTTVRLFPTNGSFYYTCLKTGHRVLVKSFKRKGNMVHIVEVYKW
jgi:hypothetical protein